MYHFQSCLALEDTIPLTRIMHLRIFQRESRLQIQVCGNVQNHTPKKEEIRMESKENEYNPYEERRQGG